MRASFLCYAPVAESPAPLQHTPNQHYLFYGRKTKIDAHAQHLHYPMQGYQLRGKTCMRQSLHHISQKIQQQLRENQMLRHSALLFTGYLTAHALNLLYQMIVSRKLPANEYTLLAAFVGALLIVQYPLMTLTTALSRYSSLLMQAGRHGDVRRLLTRWLLRSMYAGLALAAIGLWFRAPISQMLHIDRTGPVMVAAISLPAFLILPVVLGVSQGIQRFDWNAGTTMAGSLTRVLLGTLLILIFYPTSGWGLLAHGAGTGFNVFALVAGLYWIMHKQQATETPLPKLRLFLLQSGLVQLAYATLMTADVILVKHLIPQEDAFAYAATLGRMTVFLSSTIVIAMFPKVTSSGHITQQQFQIFKQSLLYTALCAAIAITGCLLFPRFLLRFLFGIHAPSPTLVAMTMTMAIIMGISALLNTCLQFLVAQKRFLPTCWVILAAILYIAACALFHSQTWHILIWSAAANTLALLALLPACLYTPTGIGHPKEDS